MTLAVIARVLGLGCRLDQLSRVLTLVSVIGLIGPGLMGFHPPVTVRSALAGAAAAGLTELWFALRVGLDAGIFGDLADVNQATDWRPVDSGLGLLGLMPPAKAGRPLAPRIAGALRLLRCQAGALAVQLLCLAVAAAL